MTLHIQYWDVVRYSSNSYVQLKDQQTNVQHVQTLRLDNSTQDGVLTGRFIIWKFRGDLVPIVWGSVLQVMD